jgi:general bacterial porin, GBP family
MGVSMLRNKSDAAGVTTIKEGGTLGYASYDFGSFKLIGYYQADQQSGKEKNKLTGIRVNVPVTSDLLITASYAAVKNASSGYVATADDDSKILALKAIYSLSKRTAIYALVTDVSNDANANLAVSTTGSAGKDARGVAFGVRHAF